MATFSLLITSSPTATQHACSALLFAQTVAKSQKHELKGVFFYQDGVHNANSLQQYASDELDLYAGWTTLARQTACPLQVCVTVAGKRGVLTKQDSLEIEVSQFTLESPFESVGLGELAHLYRSSDRVIQF